MIMKAAVLHGYNQEFNIEEVELAEPGAGQVLVKLLSCGVCHTDEMVRRGFQTPMPAVLGHEGAGIVERLGFGVKGVSVGDHVVLSFPSCGHCPNCLSGSRNNCYDSFTLNFGGAMPDGTRPISQNGKPLSSFFGQSSFAEYAVSDINSVVVVDKDVDLRLLGPLGCGVQTGAGAVINVLSAKPGNSIVVFGAGSVGLSAVMAAKACGCTTIIVVDVVDSRLGLAKTLGATHTINSKATPDILGRIFEIKAFGVDLAFDNTGVPACIKAALGSLRKGGKGAGVAVTGKMELEAWTDLFRAKSWAHIIEGECVPQLFIPRLIEMYKAGLFPIDKITSFFPFAEINDAFKATFDGRAVKAVLVMSEDER